MLGGATPGDQSLDPVLYNLASLELRSYLTVYGIMLAYRNPLGVSGTLSSDCSLYKTVNHKHNFRSHDAVCVFIIWLTTQNWTKKCCLI